MEGWGGPHVEAILAAPDGPLWFGTRDGVFRLTYPGDSPPADPQDGTWARYSQADGRSLSDVWAIATAPDGALWFGTLDGAFRLQAGPETPTWTAYTSADGLAHDWVEAIAVGPDGALWFGTHGGVSRYVPSD